MKKEVEKGYRQPFYIRLCNGLHEKLNTIFIKKDITVVIDTHFNKVTNTIHDTSICDAITKINDKMVLKVFINTIAKPHVKRFTIKS